MKKAAENRNVWSTLRKDYTTCCKSRSLKKRYKINVMNKQNLANLRFFTITVNNSTCV